MVLARALKKFWNYPKSLNKPAMIIEEILFCQKCKTEKSVEDFYKHDRSMCRHCRSTYQSTKRREQRYDLKKYGITKDDYQRLLIQQKFSCAICETPHREEPERKWARACLAVDHNHKTGKVRGLLCQKCNTMLGLISEREDLLKRALAYIHQWENRL